MVEVSQADQGFKHIASDTASSQHRKVVGGLASSAQHHHGAVGAAFHVERSDCCAKLVVSL